MTAERLRRLHLQFASLVWVMPRRVARLAPGAASLGGGRLCVCVCLVTSLVVNQGRAEEAKVGLGWDHVLGLLLFPGSDPGARTCQTLCVWLISWTTDTCEDREKEGRTEEKGKKENGCCCCCCVCLCLCLPAH